MTSHRFNNGVSYFDEDGEHSRRGTEVDRKTRKEIKEGEIRSYLKIDLVVPPLT